ncbi:MAG: tetratricopeptide repeat protein [Spirochaetota bacterium]
MFNLVKKLLIKYYENRAMNNLVENNFPKAEMYFQKVLDINKDKPGSYYNLGIVKLSMKKFEEAEDLFKKELQRNEDNYKVKNALADLYYIWGKKDEALKYYEEVYKIEPNEKQSKLIEKRIKHCKDDEAYEKVKESINHFEKGNKYLNEKKYEDALKEFENAISLDKTNFFAYNNIGSIYMNYYVDYDKALNYFEKANNIVDLPVIKQNINRIRKYLAKNQNKK